MHDVRSALEALVKAFDGHDPAFAEDYVDFHAGRAFVIANVRDDVERLRIRCYLPTDDEGAVRDWVAAQPAPRSGLLQVDDPFGDGRWRPRLLFERPLGPDGWRSDPLFEELDLYLSAWEADGDAHVDVAALEHIDFWAPGHPIDVEPTSAWLLKGDEASYLTQSTLEEYRETSRVGIHMLDWTTAPQTEFGDLALFYFMAPLKAIHFVARAASNPTFSTEIPVNADGKVADAQWWGYFTAPIEIEPIPFKALQSAADGYLPIKGRSGRFLPPKLIERLSFRAMNPAEQQELDRIARPPVGLADLPAPSELTIDTWQNIAAGALRLEADVSTYIVEPLLRLLLGDSTPTWRAEYRVDKGFADYVLLDGDQPRHVIEVKKAIKRPPEQSWEESPDLQQLRRYAAHLGVPGTLIDSHRIVLVPRVTSEPIHEIRRGSATPDELAAIRAHMEGGPATMIRMHMKDADTGQTVLTVTVEDGVVTEADPPGSMAALMMLDHKRRRLTPMQAANRLTGQGSYVWVREGEP